MAVEMYGVTFSFVQNGLSSLMNWPRPQGVCIENNIFPFVTSIMYIAQEKFNFKGFVSSKNGLYFFSLIFSFSVTVLHLLSCNPGRSVLIRLCRM